MKIAYFGTGLLGAGFVKHFLELGHTVHVWNRSPEKAKALEADGAIAFDDPAAALAGAMQLHLTLADDASIDAVLEPLATVIAKSTVIIDHTTTAPTPTGERIGRWADRGIRYLHTPVMMGPAQARKAQGLMFVSGDRALVNSVMPTLQRMTGKVIDYGNDPMRAAAFKLMGNLMVITLMAGLGDVNRLADSVGISTADAMGLFAEFNAGAMVGLRASKIASNDFTPTFELTMARKDARLMVEEAQRHGVRLGVVPAILDIYDEAIARGDGALDTSAIARIPAKR